MLISTTDNITDVKEEYLAEIGMGYYDEAYDCIENKTIKVFRINFEKVRHLPLHT